jgi:ABC-type multidrug transport system fused ATPase/permease subunit
LNYHTNIGGFVYNAWGQMLMKLVVTLITVYVGAKLSKTMFRNILKKVMKAPINLFFDITPMSKVMGYFTRDIDQIDSHLFSLLSWVSTTVINCFTKIAIATYFSPALGLFTVLNFFILQKYRTYIKATKDECTRIDKLSVTRTRTHFDQTCSGMTINRAFDRLEKCTQMTLDYQNQNKIF